MLWRRYWGSAGGALMGIALAGAIADIIALTTADRAHVPLWPLALCVVLFVAGFVLFVFRAPEQTHATVTAIADPAPSVPEPQLSITSRKI